MIPVLPRLSRTHGCISPSLASESSAPRRPRSLKLIFQRKVFDWLDLEDHREVLARPDVDEIIRVSLFQHLGIPCEAQEIHDDLGPLQSALDFQRAFCMLEPCVKLHDRRVNDHWFCVPPPLLPASVFDTTEENRDGVSTRSEFQQGNAGFDQLKLIFQGQVFEWLGYAEVCEMLTHSAVDEVVRASLFQHLGIPCEAQELHDDVGPLRSATDFRRALLNSEPCFKLYDRRVDTRWPVYPLLNDHWAGVPVPQVPGSMSDPLERHHDGLIARSALYQATAPSTDAPGPAAPATFATNAGFSTLDRRPGGATGRREFQATVMTPEAPTRCTMAIDGVERERGRTAGLPTGATTASCYRQDPMTGEWICEAGSPGYISTASCFIESSAASPGLSSTRTASPALARTLDLPAAIANLAFDALDKNHDGVITRSELNQGVAEAGGWSNSFFPPSAAFEKTHDGVVTRRDFQVADAMTLEVPTKFKVVIGGVERELERPAGAPLGSTMTYRQHPTTGEWICEAGPPGHMYSGSR